MFDSLQLHVVYGIAFLQLKHGMDKMHQANDIPPTPLCRMPRVGQQASHTSRELWILIWCLIRTLLRVNRNHIFVKIAFKLRSQVMNTAATVLKCLRKQLILTDHIQ